MVRLVVAGKRVGGSGEEEKERSTVERDQGSWRSVFGNMVLCSGAKRSADEMMGKGPISDELALAWRFGASREADREASYVRCRSGGDAMMADWTVGSERRRGEADASSVRASSRWSCQVGSQ